MNIEAMKALKSDEVFENSRIPSLIIRGGKDTVVCNNKIQEFFETMPSTDKQMITYDDVDH